MLGQCGACVVVVVAATKSIFYHFFLDTLLSLLLSFVWSCFKHTSKFANREQHTRQDRPGTHNAHAQ